MNSVILYFVSLFVHFFPETKFFGLKSILYRLAGVKTGKNVRICSSARFLGIGQLEIGDNTWIGHNVLIISSSCVKIGCNVDIAPNVYIGTGSHKITYEGDKVAGKGYNAAISIGNGCWLCVNSTILPQVTIGQNTLVAAGAVVTKDTPSYSMVAGIPAKVTKKFNSSNEDI
jgi:putative colanic acid biosynthesis acetyltransferase WcaF